MSGIGDVYIEFRGDTYLPSRVAPDWLKEIFDGKPMSLVSLSYKLTHSLETLKVTALDLLKAGYLRRVKARIKYRELKTFSEEKTILSPDGVEQSQSPIRRIIH